MRTRAARGEAEETGIAGCGVGREEHTGGEMVTESMEGNDSRWAESMCAL